MGYWVIEELTELAEQGDADAQFDLGSHYLHGEFVEPDVEKALYYWVLAAKQGNVDALCELGEHYFYRDNSTMHYQTAVDYWKKAASHGSLKAHYYLSQCYFLGNGVSEDYHKAIEHCRIPAEKGIAEAQYLLGEYYRVGLNDLNMAAQWNDKSAKQGFHKAQHNLAIRYHKMRNYEKAAEWFEKAANQGYMYSQYSLGDAYLYGEGVEQNAKLAQKWFQLAAMQGHKDAQKVSATLHEKLKYKKYLDEQDLLELDELMEKFQACPFCNSGLKKNATECDDCGAKKVELYGASYIFSAILNSILFSLILTLFIPLLLKTEPFITWGIMGIGIFLAFMIKMKLYNRKMKNTWEKAN